LKTLMTIIVAFFLFCTKLAFSQDVFVNVHGRVTDDTGSYLSGATVIFTSLANETSQEAVTDDNGYYSLDIEITETSVQEENSSQPQNFILFQNYPNPFNQNTIIEFEIIRTTHVKLTVYNILGQSVCELANREYPAGRFSVLWNGTDDNGNYVSAGLYFYRMQAGQFIQTNKMLLLDSGMGGEGIQKIVGKYTFAQKTLQFEEPFRVRVEKNGYMINGKDFVNVSSMDTSIEQNFSLITLNMQRALCYYFSDEEGWRYILSPLDGSIPEKIVSSNSVPRPAWSPDGNYFAYIQSRSLYVMELKTGDIKNLGVTNAYGGNNGLEWTPDSGEIIFFRFAGGTTYIPYSINRNGSNVQELPYFFAYKKFFLKDNFHFIYVDSLKVYTSDLDTIPPEEILNLTELLHDADYINPKTFVFNPHTNGLITKSRTGDVWSLSNINIETSEISVIEQSNSIGDCIYSSDFSKIAYMDGSNIVIIEGNEKRVIKAKRSDEYFDFNGWSFSPGGEYIAYGRYIADTSSFWINWIHSLYILNIETEEIVFVDSWAIMPSWNPNFPY